MKTRASSQPGMGMDRKYWYSFVSANGRHRARFDGAMFNVLGYKVSARIAVRVLVHSTNGTINDTIRPPAWFGSGKVMTVGLRFPVRAAPCRSGQQPGKKSISRR